MDILQRANFDYRTPEGMFRLMFAATGDEQKSRQAANEVQTQRQIAAVTK